MADTHLVNPATPEPEAVLVVFDGGLAATAASLLGGDTSQVIAWVPPSGTPCVDAPEVAIGPGALAAAQRLGEMLAFKAVETMAPQGLAAGGAAPESAIILLDACRRAQALHIERVVWPVIAGRSVEALQAVMEIAGLISRLSWAADPLRPGAEPPRVFPTVHTPLADLTAEEVVDLALDLDAPVEAVWWRQGPAGAPVRGVWESLLRAAASRRGLGTAPPQAVPEPRLARTQPETQLKS